MKNLHKIFALFLSFSVLSTILMPVARATSTLDSVPVLVQNKISEWNNSNELAQVKYLTDFAGNSYTLAECTPSGYLIYNNQTSIIVENAPNSLSPYQGRTSGLYYAGPTKYYYYDLSAHEYKHTILDEVLSADTVIYQREICCQMQLALKQQKTELLQKANSPGLTTTADVYKYVGNHKSFFTNLTTANKMGYYCPANSDGVCGYVASGLVLLYFDYYHNGNFIDNGTYLASSGSAFKNGNFTKFLYENIGKSELNYTDDAINATQAAKVMQKYLSVSQNISVSYWSATMPTASDVVNQIDKGRPVIYTDRWYTPQSNSGDTVDHSIVIYGYNYSTNDLVAHFGWEGYAEVMCSSPVLATFISTASTLAV